MARIHELLRQLRLSNAALADDIEREVDVLGARRAFGLNFERHTPEAVELPGRPVRTGDKVHVLPPRGETAKAANSKLLRVVSIQGERDKRVAILEPQPRDETNETAAVAVADLVVVAEFRDPIYPGLASTGRVERGGDKPFHTVINGENYHALQTLLFAHRGGVDAIYIDPPYNTGAKDWKYNNDYVEADDLYRHSKWLAFMERRLVLAKELLNPANSVLVVTIDEKEYLRTGLLLEQTFPEADIQMITSVINPKGSARQGRFSRTDEYLFFVMLGDAAVTPWKTDMIRDATPDASAIEVRWAGLLRNGEGSARSRIPSMFYPIYLDEKTGAFHSVGEPPPASQSRDSIVGPPGTVTLLPIDGSGRELMWRLNPASLRKYLVDGYAKFGKRNPSTGLRSPYYLQSGVLSKIALGDVVVDGHDEEGAVKIHYQAGKKTVQPMTLWNRTSHSASEHGATILKALIPGRKFPYPKSLYAVEDSIRFFVSDKPEALVIDFFSGSGTTAHAVMRLNRQDGGRRTSISVTNNEVSSDEQGKLRAKGLRAGDPDWERWGICEYVTKPRILAAVTGESSEGNPIIGDYKFTDEFPMAEGFEENVEFLSLTYEAPLRLRANRDFERIAPLLWMRAGSRGGRIESLPDGWAVVEAYGVIADLDSTDPFFRALAEIKTAAVAFVITDDDGLFEAMAGGLPTGVEPIRLYDAYLRNFEIDAMRGAR